MRKLFGLFSVGDTVGSPLYKPGDKAVGVYAYRKLHPNTTVLIDADNLQGMYTISRVDSDKIWLQNATVEGKEFGPYHKSAVKAVMIFRYRPRRNR